MANASDILGTGVNSGCPVKISGEPGQTLIVDAAGCPVFADPTTGNPSTLTDNGDGTWTHLSGDGTPETFRTCCPDGYTDPETGDILAPGGPSSVALAMADGTARVFCEGADAVVASPTLTCSPRGLLTGNIVRDGKRWLAEQVSEHDEFVGRASAFGLTASGPFTEDDPVTPIAAIAIDNPTDRPMVALVIFSIVHIDLFKTADGNEEQIGVKLKIDLGGGALSDGGHIYFRTANRASADFGRSFPQNITIPACTTVTVRARLDVWQDLSTLATITTPGVAIAVIAGTEAN